MAKKDALLIPLLSRILDVPEAALHDDRNLMHYGMDSMRTMRAATLLRRERIAVTFSDFIGKRTVKEWRQVISVAEEYRAVTDADAQPCDTPGFELATMQHAFWIGRNERQQLGGVSAHFYAEMDGKALDPERLASALHRMIQRHDMLRLRIDEDARLRIAPDSPCQLQINDLRELSTEQCHGRLAALRQRYTHQQLDIANGETLMLALSLLPTGYSRLNIDLDMIAGDAASLRILLRGLALGYRQPDYVLPPLRASYRDYQQRWQKKHQHRREHDRAWWQTQLSRLATSFTLPLQSSEKSAPVTERRYLWLNPTQQQLTTMSHQSGLSVPVILATIFGECIGLWSGGAPFLLNLPVFSRDEEIDDADRLVGDFSSSVLISVEPGSAESIIEQARQLQTQLHRALAHTAWSGVDVLRDLSRQQQSNASLAPVVFTSALALGDLFEPQVRAVLGEPVWSVSQGPQVLIDAQATEYLNGIMLNWDVRTDRFAPGVIDAMFDGFQQQVHALLDDIMCWQRKLPVPPLVAPWQPEITEPASVPTLLHRFFMQAEREPDAIALQWGEHGVLHYGELAKNALCIARFLQEQGIKTGDSVAISMGKGPEQVMAVLGTLAAGATYVPCGIDIPLARREAVYRLSNVALVVCDFRRTYQPEWPQGTPVFPLVQGLPLAAPAEVDEQQAMYVIFTSGTTGEPKGVAVSHRAVANTVDGVDAHFTATPSDCTITLSALDFDLSAYDIFSCLSRGARLAVVDEHQRRDAHELLALIHRYDVSIISCVPALLEMILTAAGDTPLSSARLVMLGGDRIPLALAERWWRRTAGAPFVGLGGMTEAAIHSTLFVLHADDPRWTTVPFGTPLPNMYCRIVDALGRDCPPWVAGELWVSCPGLALGYRNDAERTAEKFVECAGRRWYRSGDRVRYWPDGTIDYLGRNDQQIKIRGHRIEPGEVEAALMRHPAIQNACVTVVTQAARQLCATLVTDQNNSASIWQGWLQPLLPRYAIPEHYVVVPALSVTENGKTDRASVERIAASQITLARTARSAPENDIERQVAALWAMLLNVDSVSSEDNFFVLGGDSLIATRLIAALRERQLSAPLHALFTSPELRDFCHYVQADVAVSLQVLVADDVARYQPFPLSDIQRAFWIGRSEQMTLGGVGSHFYIEFDGKGLDVARLETAWQQLISRHAMLRAVVADTGEQQVLPDTRTYRIDRHTAGDDVEGTLQTWRDTLSHWVYDVREWPLFSIHVLDYQQGGDARQRLIVSLDSMMFDGRSIMILFTEWDALYRNPTATLPALRIHYRDYQCVQAEHGAALMPQAKAYWLERLATLPAAPALPLAVRPETISKPRFQRRRYVLPAESWQRFMSQAQQHGITASVALAAAYGEVLAYWSNQSALALNFTLFDRQPLHPDINRVVGDFASILLLGYETAQGKDFCQATMQLQQQVGEGLSHRQFSGVQVLREPARYHGRSMATMPVVFTSVLRLEKDPSMALSDAFPRAHYTLTQTPQVWLDAKVSESHGCLLLEWDVVEALFPPGIIDSLFAASCHLVESMVQADWCQLISLSLPVEQQRLREQINQTAMDFGDNTAPYLRVFVKAQRAPQATALVWGDHGVMHYGEMTRQALSVAAYLVQQGIQPGDKVAITHCKWAAQIVAVLGVLAAGGCYVPCNIALPLARREQIYQAAQVRWVLTDIEGALTRLPEVDEAVVVVVDAPSQQVAAALVCPEATEMADIKQAIQTWLPEYEGPEHLIRIARVSLTANGKIDRAAIREEVHSYLNGLRDERAGGLPVGRAEQVLATLWGALLDLDTVTREANFFALGGDSLIATRLISRLPQEGFHGSLASLFRHPVLHAFAATLRDVTPEQQIHLHHDAAQRYHPFPLNDVQEAYWLGRRDRFVLGGIAAQYYHEYELQHASLMRLEQAWNQLVTLHDMLRRVIGDDGQLSIMEEVPYFYLFYKLLCDFTNASAQLALLRNRMAHQILSAGSGRLYDITLIDYGAGKSRLAVLFDNLIVDGLSMLTLFSEWFECYQNPETELPPLAIQFRDYQCLRAQQGQTGEDIVYWQQRFDALPPAPALPTRMLPAAIITPRFRRLEAQLEPALWRQLSDRARQARITPSVLLLACFAEMLSRWSGQKALVITLTQFDRQQLHPDINRVVGDFTSLTLAEYHTDNAESWLRHAQRLQEKVWRDLGHASVSAISVQRALAQRTGNEMQAAQVVFTSMLGVADALAKALPWPNYTSSQTPQVWLDHQVIDLADGVLLSWDYLEELFLPDMVEQMFAWYCHTLRALAGNDWLAPPIRDLPVAQRQIRLQANTTGGPMPSHRALHDAFFSQAQQRPERPALWDSVNGYLSYGALCEQALMVAAGLLRRGIHSGDCVALCLTPGSERVVALLGILAAGAAYLPLNQAHPAARHELLCRKGRAKAVICDNELSFSIPTYSLASLRDNAPLTAPIISSDDTLAYVLFTSGTTGEPKGVMIEHRNVLNTLEAVCQQLDISAQDVFLAVSALDFDLSVFDLFAALSVGCLLVLAEDSPHHDADRWLTLMSTHGVSVWNSVPSLFNMLHTLACARQVTLPDLRIALLSVDWVEPDSGEQLRTLSPSAQAFALGGATEAAIWSTIWPMSSPLPEGCYTVPYGFPLRNQRFRVVDALGNDTPDWIPGELWIGVLGVARGYCADARLTALHFNCDYPWRWYRTGDRGRYGPDGVLEFLGRIDNQVKLQGHRIELGEIESILLRPPQVRHAVAVVQGDGATAGLYAYVQMDATEEEINALLSALHHELRITLPGYAIPGEISAVTTWPLTTSWKIDRRQLAMSSPRSSLKNTYIISKLNNFVAALWQQLVEGPLPSGTDSFFRACGNSLLWTKLVAQVCERFSINLTIREFFSDATLSGLCACVERHLADRALMEEGSL